MLGKNKQVCRWVLTVPGAHVERTGGNNRDEEEEGVDVNRHV
jgi:hypothetical protein